MDVVVRRRIQLPRRVAQGGVTARFDPERAGTNALMNFPRTIEPEWLDALAPRDPRAMRSRRDLRAMSPCLAVTAISTV